MLLFSNVDELTSLHETMIKKKIKSLYKVKPGSNTRRIWKRSDDKTRHGAEGPQLHGLVVSL